jgi:hypothetical protein
MQTLKKENSSIDTADTKTTQPIFFDDEMRQRLARPEDEIFLSDTETCRADAMRNSIPISKRLCRFVARSFSNGGSLNNCQRPVLVSVVAENRTQSPPKEK